jgi:hypothetical protein
VIATDLLSSSRRLYRWTAVLAAIGALSSVMHGGISWLLGFLAGAAVSVLNLLLFHKLVQRVGETGEKGPKKVSIALLGGRYLLFSAAVYAIVVCFEASLTAVLIGCFVSVAAVILDILYELIYGT